MYKKRNLFAFILLGLALLLISATVVQAQSTATITINFVDLEPGDSNDLSNSSTYYLEFNNGLGNYGSGSFTATLDTMPKNVSYRAHSGGLAGPWVGLTINGATSIDYTYVAFDLTLTGADGTNLTDLQHFLEFNYGQGNLYNDGGVLYTPVGANPSFLAHGGTLTGPWTALASYMNIQDTSSKQSLSYRYVAFNAHLYHGSVNLTDPKYFLEFNYGQGSLFDNGGVLYTPVGANPSFLAHSGTLTGPWTALASYLDLQNTGSLQTLNYQYVAFTANLFNTGEALNTDTYFLEFNYGQGSLYDNDYAPLTTLYTPVGANPAFLAHTGFLIGPWTTLANAGINISDPGSDQVLNYEYISFTALLHNNGVVLNDPAYYLEFNYGLGNLYADGTILHTPIGANPSFRVHTGSLGSSWIALNSKVSIVAGTTANVPAIPNVQTLELEYATVTFTFQPALPANLANMMSTQISSVGAVANNGIVHLPPNTNISFRAQRGSWGTKWYTQSFESGDGTVYWGIGPTYVGPTP